MVEVIYESISPLMERSRRSGRASLGVVLAIALLSSGCAFRRAVAGMAIEHNEFVAQATNRQTVLNILRAREREPMHFTSLTQVNGKVQGQGQLGLNTTANGDGSSLTQVDTTTTNTGPTGSLTGAAVTNTINDVVTRGATNWAPSAQVSVTTGTDFQIAVNATQDFYRGIMGPLSPGILVYYLREGFPRDLLSHLAIRELTFHARITGPDGAADTIPLGDFSNAPDEAAAAARFADVLKCWQLSYAPNLVAATTMPAPELHDLSGLSMDMLGRLRRVEDKSGTVSYQLVIAPARNEYSLTLADAGEPGCEMRGRFRQAVSDWARGRGLQLAPPRSGTAPPPVPSERHELAVAQSTGVAPAGHEPSISQGVSGSGGATLNTSGDYYNDLLPPGYKSELVMEMTIRSVEGILYYLGEYIRNEPSRPLLWYDHCPDGGAGYCLPIIRVRPASEIRPAERFVDVVYRGRLYAVPMAGAHLNTESGRSSQAISLVQQLLNLHRSASELPSTPFVRIAN